MQLIAFVKGLLDDVFDGSVVIDVGGVGYQVYISPGTLSKLGKTGETVKMYTYMQVREDGVSLYGFLSMEEINAFNLLTSVSGVGPRVALSALSDATPNEIMLAIITEDYAKLSTLPGIGKKIAQRIVLELKDKVTTNDAIMGSASVNHDLPVAEILGAKNEKNDAVGALLALGYSRSEAVRGVLAVATEGMSTAEIIKQTLRLLSS